MGRLINKIGERWEVMKASGSLHNLAVFIVFVAVATMFWLILALNDTAQDNFDTGLEITGVPDSVTFITDPPTQMHVTVRDRGTSLLRAGVFRHPSVKIDFKDYAHNGVLRLSHGDLIGALKHTYGATAQIVSVSIDSVRIVYTTGAGKRVPVSVVSEITPAPGSVLSGAPLAERRTVLVYSADRALLDTLTRVYTQKIVRRGLEEPTEVTVQLKPVAGARVVPDQVAVRIPIEPLIAKESSITVRPRKVPAGESLLLFPTKVPVRYYVPMSRFSEDDSGFEVTVEYDDILRHGSNRLPLQLRHVPAGVFNAVLGMDSVEYTIIR